MDKSIDILNELQNLSPVIARMEKVNPFTVPAGYFEQLGQSILINVKEEVVLTGTINKQVMDVPVGYFESLAGNILNKIKAGESSIEEVKTLSPVLYNISNKNVFTVPEGYFESLPEIVAARITTALDAATEIKALSPMLYSIQNENVFTVPKGYFQSLPENVLLAMQPQQTKVVPMPRRISTILKYAVAAVFTGVMALGVYKFVDSGKPMVAAIPEYVKDGQKIENVDAELAKVSDDDIIKYLQVNGTDVDAALVASSVDDKELPTQEDFLTDDKALDKFLDNVDLNDLKN